jgi:2-polyprenyl-6-methoxyphenol hydroxylase-like FAD-dependent oxidoreductase
VQLEQVLGLVRLQLWLPKGTPCRSQIERNYLTTLDLAPGLAERVRSTIRADRLAGGVVANYFRKPYGPGWMLGDASCCKDLVTAQGISATFRDAEAVAAALSRVFDGGSREQIMRDYHHTRDSAGEAMYRFTADMATARAQAAATSAIQDNQAAMNAFASVIEGTLAPAEFFASPA